MSAPDSPAGSARRIKQLLGRKVQPYDTALSDAYRDVLRAYRVAQATGGGTANPWGPLVDDALLYLGGQSDRLSPPLASYDHNRFGPFLGVSNEGSGAATITEAAYGAPKVSALGRKATPLSVGVGVDAERLSSVGEVPAGPGDFAEIWRACVGRSLITTNVGSRVNLRLYRPAPVLRTVAKPDAQEMTRLTTGLDAFFKPYNDAPGGARPLVVFVEFTDPAGTDPAGGGARETLRALVEHVGSSAVAKPRLHSIGLSLVVGGDPAAVTRGIDLARSAGLTQVMVNGTVSDAAEEAISLPGLMNFFSAGQTDELLRYADTKGVGLRTPNPTDTDAVAHEIWSALNTARSVGLNLGKYGLFPLTLEESDYIVGRIQQWFPDWSAAPVFYVDQGLVSAKQVFHGDTLELGVATWLRMVARHGVKLVLIDTVEKGAGWKILKVDGDPKGLMTEEVIARLNALGESLGVKTMWAGGLSPDQTQQLSRVGVFGVYVTTAVSEAAPVSGIYARDPALASVKRPTIQGIVHTKTLIEAGFLAGRFGAGRNRSDKVLKPLLEKIEAAGNDSAQLARILPGAWRAWWRHLDAAGKK